MEQPTVRRITFTLFAISVFFVFSPPVDAMGNTIVINEIGAYEPAGHEWIEIVNVSNTSINIDGWILNEWESEKPSPNHKIFLSQGDDMIVDAGEYAIIAQNAEKFKVDYPIFSGTLFDSSWGTLNESGELISLKYANGIIIESFTYISAPNFSLERIDATTNDYSDANWKEHPSGNTVGRENYWTTIPASEPANIPPTAIATASATTAVVGTAISFDASQSSDTDGTITGYSWQFGDGSSGNGIITTHTFATAGTYPVLLTITDNDGSSSSQEIQIHISESAQSVSTTSSIVFNEFLTNPESGSEWIELYNTSNTSIDLTGYTLFDGTGQIASPTSTIVSHGFIIIELNSNKLNNSGDILILKQPDSTTIDQVSYGNWNDGNSTDNAPAPEKGSTLARISDGYDTNTDANDWHETTTLTKGTANQPVKQNTTPQTSSTSPGNSSEDDALPNPITYASGTIVINELVSDPADGDVEFVELYNRMGTPIDLTGWWIEDGSETKTILNGTIQPYNFFVIEQPKGNLNNSGDDVTLFEPTGYIIDHVAYGTWNDGNLGDNTPVAPDPESLARIYDGQDVDNDFFDFARTYTITKNAKNKITTKTDSGHIEPTLQNTQAIIVNELFPNPAGSDSDDEFIELFNTSDTTIDITGWKLGDSSKRTYTITDGRISAHGFLLLKRQQTGIALNNTGGEMVELKDESGRLVDSVHYASVAVENQSYARDTDGRWAWTTDVTPNKTNSITGISATPVVSIDADTEGSVGEAILFDGSDTIDPDGEIMTFEWNFGDTETEDGDVVRHAFQKEGVYTVTLTVTDASNNVSTKKILISVSDESTAFTRQSHNDNAVSVRISEFLPNPEGSDTTEFIELFNPTDIPIILDGIKLDDEDGGSRAYTIPQGTIIDPHTYIVFGKQDTKLALNNTSDSVRVLFPDNTVIAEVTYDDVIEGASYIQNEDEQWVWSMSQTPGTENIVTEPMDEPTASARSKMIIDTTLSHLRDEDIGDILRVSGIVAVTPNVFGSQYFYIVDTAGVQIYMNKKDFPPFSIGDRMTVTGQLSEINGEARIKVSQKSNMVISAHPGDPPATPIQIVDVGESFEGALIVVNGEVTERKSTYLWVDDGTDEVKVYFKKGASINPSAFSVGDMVSATGILSQTASGYQILPRAMSDIKTTGVSESYLTSTIESSPPSATETYLTVTAGGLSSILLAFVAKARGGLAKSVIKRVAGVGLAFFKRKL